MEQPDGKFSPDNEQRKYDGANKPNSMDAAAQTRSKNEGGARCQQKNRGNYEIAWTHENSFENRMATAGSSSSKPVRRTTLNSGLRNEPRLIVECSSADEAKGTFTLHQGERPLGQTLLATRTR